MSLIFIIVLSNIQHPAKCQYSWLNRSWHKHCLVNKTKWRLGGKHRVSGHMFTRMFPDLMRWIIYPRILQRHYETQLSVREKLREIFIDNMQIIIIHRPLHGCWKKKQYYKKAFYTLQRVQKVPHHKDFTKFVQYGFCFSQNTFRNDLQRSGECSSLI